MTGPPGPTTAYACGSCGNTLQPTDRFCGACGTITQTAGGFAEDRRYPLATTRDTSKVLLLGLPLVVIGVAVAATIANRRSDVVENAGALTGDAPASAGHDAPSVTRLPIPVTAGDTRTASTTRLGTTPRPGAATVARARPRQVDRNPRSLTTPSNDGQTDADAVRAQIELFVRALNGRNAQRVAALYATGSPHDQQNLDFLLGTLRRANLRATLLNVSAPELGWTEATAVFTVRLSWKPAVGAAQSRTVTFGAMLENVMTATTDWRLIGVRATEKLR